MTTTAGRLWHAGCSSPQRSPLDAARHGPRSGTLASSPGGTLAATLLRYGYWDYRALDQMIVDLLGKAAARVSGFPEALASEHAGQSGTVLQWARTPGKPSTVRAIVEISYPRGVPDGRFDEVEIARASRPPAAQDGPVVVTLFARRHDGAIYYRLAGLPAGAPPPPTAAPLAADAAYGLACGSPGSIVTFGVELLLGMFEPDQKLTAEVVAVALAGADWMPRASSTFYDFHEIEETIRRAVLDQVLAHFGLAPRADQHQ
jgi:hypothetical protein